MDENQSIPVVYSNVVHPLAQRPRDIEWERHIPDQVREPEGDQDLGQESEKSLEKPGEKYDEKMEVVPNLEVQNQIQNAQSHLKEEYENNFLFVRKEVQKLVEHKAEEEKQRDKLRAEQILALQTTITEMVGGMHLQQETIGELANTVIKSRNKQEYCQNQLHQLTDLVNISLNVLQNMEQAEEQNRHWQADRGSVSSSSGDTVGGQESMQMVETFLSDATAEKQTAESHLSEYVDSKLVETLSA
ncbi:MAG: hypothetical protein Phog2KO_50980 [Phototrophicaceae bacterium]